MTEPTAQVGLGEGHDAAAAAETVYERNQRFNPVIRWVHGIRYKYLLRLFRRIAADAGRPVRVIDIGCAHAKLFDVLNGRFPVDYVGIEIDDYYADIARRRHAGHPNFRVIHGDAAREVGGVGPVDVVVALETLEHIPEHDVVRLVEAIAAARPQLFVCSVPVEVGPAVWLKNVFSLLTGYSRHREYTWAETFWAGVYALDRLPPHGTGHKGFDWRWLAQTIRHNFEIVKLRKSPFSLLPAAVSMSVFMVARPREARP